MPLVQLIQGKGAAVKQAMEGSGKREAPASMESLAPDVLALVAEHFTSECSPLYDRSDILKQASAAQPATCYHSSRR